ncbi:MAG: hypothetical protein AB7Q97_06635 [Gammaproteobacteria bacterium]
MNDRLYFLGGDILSNAGTGVLAGLVSAAIVDTGWHAVLAVPLCVVACLLLSMVVGPFVFMRYFGAMEVVVPNLLTAATTAAVVGARAAMVPYPALQAAWHGAIIGLAVLAFTRYCDYLIRNALNRAETR